LRIGSFRKKFLHQKEIRKEEMSIRKQAKSKRKRKGE
jgi:hypothetical protein